MHSLVLYGTRIADPQTLPEASRHHATAASFLHPQCMDVCAGFGIQMEGDSGRNIITNNIFVNVAQQADMHAIVLAGAPAIWCLDAFRRQAGESVSLPVLSRLQQAARVTPSSGALMC